MLFRSKRSARGARAIDPPRGGKNRFEPYFLRFSASLGVKSTPFLLANEVSCHDFKPHESVIKCNYRSGSQSGIPQEYDYAKITKIAFFWVFRFEEQALILSRKSLLVASNLKNFPAARAKGGGLRPLHPPTDYPFPNVRPCQAI